LEAKIPGLYITEFCQRLVEMARERVHSGEVSERGLARRSTVSQPHLHNVLKGIRTLSPDAADRLMRAMGVTIPQVLWAGSGINTDEIRAVPILRSRIGPGTMAAFEAFRGYVPFPARLVVPLVEPVAAYLAADLAMPTEYRAGDMVLLDLNEAIRTAVPALACWIVAESAGLRVRYVRRVRGGLEVASLPVLSDRRDWRAISLQGRNILDIVRARIVWIGREMETPSAGPAGPARPGD
jgi:hypothetical protein